MRKILFPILLSLTALLTLNSCFENVPDGDELKTTYKVTLSEDLVNIADMVITYKGKNGINVTDTITDTVWQKTVGLDSFPCQVGLVDYTFIPKTASELTKGTYSVTFKYYFTVTGDGPCQTVTPVNFHNLKREKVAAFLDVANDHGDMSIIYEISKGKDSISGLHDIIVGDNGYNCRPIHLPWLDNDTTTNNN